MSRINDLLSDYVRLAKKVDHLQKELFRIDKERTEAIETMAELERSLFPTLLELGETTVIHPGFYEDFVLVWNAEAEGLEWIATKHMFGHFVDPNDDEAEDDQ